MFCKNCHKSIPNRLKCPHCGVDTFDVFEAEYTELSETIYIGSPSKKEKLCAIMSYIPLLCLITLITAKSEFEKYHVRQGISLLIGLFLSNYFVKLLIDFYVRTSWSDIIYYIIVCGATVITSFLIIMLLLGIYSAFRGTCTQLPILCYKK